MAEGLLSSPATWTVESVKLVPKIYLEFYLYVSTVHHVCVEKEQPVTTTVSDHRVPEVIHNEAGGLVDHLGVPEPGDLLLPVLDGEAVDAADDHVHHVQLPVKTLITLI